MADIFELNREKYSFTTTQWLQVSMKYLLFLDLNIILLLFIWACCLRMNIAFIYLLDTISFLRSSL